MKNIGIFDPEGKNKNPFTGEKYSENYKILSNKWKNYPIYKDSEKILELMKNNRVLMIQSGTGSGKTVIIPKLALHRGNYKKNVVITGPKRTVTSSNADFAAKCLDVNLGSEVGYRYRGMSMVSDKTKLLFATDGLVLAWLKSGSEQFKNIDTLILDEVHERTVRMDLLLGLLKEALNKYKNLHLVLMSATIDVSPYKKFYKSLKLYSSPGAKLFPVKLHFLENKINPMFVLDEAGKIAIKILKSNPTQNILVFVPSANNCESGCKKLHKLLQKEKITALCAPLYSGLEQEKQDIAIKQGENQPIKVVFSTNVAESSVTVENLGYVIDTGYEWQPSYEPKKKLFLLEKKFASKAQLKQRHGRVGRVSEGSVYTLYTKKMFDKFLDYPIPDIQKSNLVQNTLELLVTYKTKSSLEKLWNKMMAVPSKQLRDDAWNELERLKLVNKTKITDLGLQVAEIKTDPIYGRLLIEAKENGVLLEMLAFISLSTVANTFTKWVLNLSFNNPVENIFKEWFDENGDPWTLLKLYITWKLVDDDEKEEWCLERNINHKLLTHVKSHYLTLKRMILPNSSNKTRFYFEETDYIPIIKNIFKSVLRPLTKVNDKGVYVDDMGNKCIWPYGVKYPEKACCLSGTVMGMNKIWWYVIGL